MKSVFCLCVAVAVIRLGSVVGAQDLGSGNKLFGSPKNPPAKKATVKNAAPKKSMAKPQTAAGKGARPSPDRDEPLTPAAGRLYETLIDDVAAFEAHGDGYMTRGNPRGAERAYRQAFALDREKAILAGKLAGAAEHS